MLSVVDIQNKEFKRNKIGGYNIDEVDDYLEQIIKSYQEVLNDNYALKDKVKVLNESIQYYRTMESTIQNVLVLADKTAQDTKAAAYEKAEQIKKEADDRAEKITCIAEERVTRIIDQGRQEAYELAQKVEDIKRQFMSYKNQFKQILQTQIDFLEKGDMLMATMEEDLSCAFSKIQKETVLREENEPSEEKKVDGEGTDEDESFYTKAYVPLSSGEIEELLKK